MRCAILIIDAAPSVPPKVRAKHLGKLVRSMDIQSGTVELCSLPHDALHFHNPGSAMRAWREKLPNGELNQLAQQWSVNIVTVI